LLLAARRWRRPLTSIPEDSASRRSAGNVSNQPTQSRPIRVLIVTARFLPELGGIENHVYEVTRRIAKRDEFDLTVLTTDRSGTLPIREEFEGFTVLRCRSYPRHRDYYFAPDLYRLIRSGNYDLIHCQGIHTAVPILAMIAARRGRIPYAVSLHTGGHSSEFRHRLRNIQWRTLGPLLRRAEVVVAVSRFEQQIFRAACNLDASHLRIVRNGGDLPTGSVRTDPIPHRIVSSGRLERYKGHQRVIEALPIVQRSIPDATLHILGAGPYERKLRALIKTLGVDSSVAIEYIAPNDRKRMGESLHRAAVFAALSEYEAHPVAVMEALTLGIPTVGLATTGIGELVEDGLVRGILKDASPTTVANALLAALESSYTSSSSTTLPTWDIAAEDLVSIYMDTVGPGRSPSVCTMSSTHTVDLHVPTPPGFGGDELSLSVKAMVMVDTSS
jgi:glycosyltransferase involved in cell wall biosynthesis